MKQAKTSYSKFDKEDKQMMAFLSQYDLTDKEKIKFLANRSGLIKISNKVVKKAQPVVIPPKALPVDNVLSKIAPNGIVTYKDLKLNQTQTKDRIKSVLKVDIDTLEPIELYTSINAASRSKSVLTGAVQLRNALYSGQNKIGGFYWVMVERMKQCSACSIWMKLTDRYRASNGKKYDAYSSYCKTCDNKRNN